MSKVYTALQMLKQLVNSRVSDEETETNSYDAVTRVIDLMYGSAAAVSSDELYDAIAGAFSNDALYGFTEASDV